MSGTTTVDRMEAARTSAAQSLLAVYASGVPTRPVSAEFPEFTVDDAYAVQLIQRAQWLRDGRTAVGHKIGLTSSAMQAQLGIDQPDFGVLLDDTAYRSGAVLQRSSFVHPKVEPEIAIIMSAPLGGHELTPSDVLRTVGSIAPAIEVIDSRIADWEIGLVDTIADNASYGAFVLGEPVALRDIDLTALTCAMSVNGVTVRTGSTGAVLGSPINSLRWLAQALTERGDRLETGDVVLTGAATAAVDVAAEDVVSVAFDVLTPITARFT